MATATRSRRGQGMVEFALVLPILLLLLLLAIDFGRVFFGWVGLQNAARIGANQAGLYPDGPWDATSDYAERIQEDAAAINCILPNPLPVPSFPEGKDAGDDVVVDMTCTFDVLTPFIGAVTGDPIELNARAVFPVRTAEIGGPGGPPPPPPETCLDVPDLDDLSVAAARSAWGTAGFTGAFFPAASAGQDAEIVLSQFPVADACVDSSSAMTVDSDPDTTTCPAGEARIPKLVGLTVQTADAAWAPFDVFSPTVSNSNKDKTVETQTTNPLFSVGACAPVSTDVSVTTANGQLKCTVPNFIGSYSAGAQSTWSAAGFEAAIGFDGSPPYTINQQDLVSGSLVKCDEDITVGP